MNSHADHVCARRRPGFRSTAEHLLTVCKDKVDAVPRLAQDYEQLVLSHAQVRHCALLLHSEIYWHMPRIAGCSNTATALVHSSQQPAL